MRGYLAIGLIGWVLAGLLVTGGCVPESQYEECLTDNRKLQVQLRNARAELLDLETASAEFNAELEKRDQQLVAAEDRRQLLSNENSQLNEDVEDLKKRLNDIIAKLKAPGPLPEPLDIKLRGFAKANPELMQYFPKYGMMKFKADLTFTKGSDVLGPEAITALRKFVEIMNADEAKGFHLYVAGHTDDIPIVTPETRYRHPNNWYLSGHRAVEVQKHLVRAGMTPKRICAMGFGEYHPIAPNKPNKKGNPLNRRVEIWIVPPGRFLTTPGE